MQQLDMNQRMHLFTQSYILKLSQQLDTLTSDSLSIKNKVYHLEEERISRMNEQEQKRVQESGFVPFRQFIHLSGFEFEKK